MKKRKLLSRRTVLKWSIHLSAFYPVISGWLHGCQPDPKKTKTNAEHTSTEKNRTKNTTAEFLFYNPKTKTLHYPGLRTKKKSDLNSFEKVPINQWEKMLESGAHFPKETSGMAFEKLALQNFKTSTNEEGMKHSLAITGRAFAKEYAYQNRLNWRMYDLLIQWIALDRVAYGINKGTTFTNIIQTVDLSSIKIPKRMSWITSEEGIEQKVIYIMREKDKYTGRLQKRFI